MADLRSSIGGKLRSPSPRSLSCASRACYFVWRPSPRASHAVANHLLRSAPRTAPPDREGLQSTVAAMGREARASRTPPRQADRGAPEPRARRERAAAAAPRKTAAAARAQEALSASADRPGAAARAPEAPAAAVDLRGAAVPAPVATPAHPEWAAAMVPRAPLVRAAAPLAAEEKEGWPVHRAPTRATIQSIPPAARAVLAVRARRVAREAAARQAAVESEVPRAAVVAREERAVAREERAAAWRGPAEWGSMPARARTRPAAWIAARKTTPTGWRAIKRRCAIAPAASAPRRVV